MTDVYLGAQPVINWESLDAELREALPGKLDGTTYAKGELTVHVHEDEDAEALRPAIETVIRAHDPAVKTAAQEAAAAREMALTELKAADLTALRDGLTAKGVTVAQLQAQVAELAAVVDALRAALGLDEPPDTRG